MARLGVETAGRAFSSINTPMVAICCERYSLQSPWELVGRSAWSARIGIARAGPLEGKERGPHTGTGTGTGTGDDRDGEIASRVARAPGGRHECKGKTSLSPGGW